METRPLTLWRVTIYFMLAYTLIYAIPSSIMVTLAARNTNKQVEIYNNDAKVVDEFNHAFVNENLKDYLPYDYDLLEGLYTKFELDPEDTLEKSKQEYGLLWRNYLQGIVIHHLVERLAFGIVNHNVWNGLIFYLIMVIIGSVITLLIYRKQPAKFFNTGPLEWLRKKLKVQEIPFTFIIILALFITILGITLAFSHPNLNEIVPGELKAEIAVFFLFLIFQCFVFLMFQITKHIRKVKSLRTAQVFDSFTVLFLIICGFAVMISTEFNLIEKFTSIFTSATTLLSTRIIPYTNFFRYIAYGSVVLTLALLVIGFIFMIYKIISKRDEEFRISYLVKFSMLIFVLFAFIRILSANTKNIDSMVADQHWHAKRSNRASLLMKLDAEVYQWYNQQIDLKESVDNIPTDFIKHLQGRDDFEFSYSWNETLLETNIKYPQDDRIIKSITYKLNVVNGTQDYDVTNEEVEAEDID